MTDDLLTYEFEEPEVPLNNPSNTTFNELIGVNFKCEPFTFKAYEHQIRAFNELKKGNNVILKAQAGSGKTEAWFSYVIYKILKEGQKDFKTLLIYPTRALSNDQFSRLTKYAGEACLKMPNLVEMYDSNKTPKHLHYPFNILITNPEKIARNLHNKERLLPYKDVNLIVIDEFDFYGTNDANKLLVLLKVLYKDIFRTQFPQFVIMSATLNLSDIKETILEKLSDGKEIITIEGNARKPKNKVKIVLGKNQGLSTSEIFHALKKYFFSNEISDQITQVIKTLDTNIRIFKKGDDNNLLSNFLNQYINSGNTTIVFAPTIKWADYLYSKISTQKDKVVIHHSLVPNREEIEAKLREGEVNLAISVITLRQGINIKSVTRIIHYGMPTSISEYLQREGRKGRDPNITTTETVIIPLTLSDLIIFASDNPEELFKKWKNLGPETTVLLKENNKFTRLVEDIYKNVINKENEKIQDLARRMRILTSKNKKTIQATFYGWHSDNVKVILDDQVVKLIDKASFVNYYQVGSIDIATESVIVKTDWNKIYEKSIVELLKQSYQSPQTVSGIEREIIKLINKYKKYKNKYYYYSNNSIQDLNSLKNALLDDIYSYRLVSYVELGIRLIEELTKGLYIVRIFPVRTIWYLNDINKTLGSIYCKKPIVSVYDVTYAYNFPLLYLYTMKSGKYVEINDKLRNEIKENLKQIISLINLILRRNYNIYFPLIRFYIDKDTENVIFWEWELTGALETIFDNASLNFSNNKTLNLESIEKDVSNIHFDDITTILLRMNGIYVNDVRFKEIKDYAVSFLQLIKAYKQITTLLKDFSNKDVFLVPLRYNNLDLVFVFSLNIYPGFYSLNKLLTTNHITADSNVYCIGRKEDLDQIEGTLRNNGIKKVTRIDINEDDKMVSFLEEKLREFDQENSEVIGELQQSNKDSLIFIQYFDSSIIKEVIERIKDHKIINNENLINNVMSTLNTTQQPVQQNRDSEPICLLITEDWSNLLRTELKKENSKYFIELNSNMQLSNNEKYKNITNSPPISTEFLSYIKKPNTRIDVVFLEKKDNELLLRSVGKIIDAKNIELVEGNKIKSIKINVDCYQPVPLRMDLDIGYEGVFICERTHDDETKNASNMINIKKILSECRKDSIYELKVCYPKILASKILSDNPLTLDQDAFIDIKSNIIIVPSRQIVLIPYNNTYVLWSIPYNCRQGDIREIDKIDSRKIIECMGLQFLQEDNYLAKQLSTKEGVEKALLGKTYSKVSVSRKPSNIVDSLKKTLYWQHYILEFIGVKKLVILLNSLMKYHTVLKMIQINNLYDVLSFIDIVKQINELNSYQSLQEVINSLRQHYQIDLWNSNSDKILNQINEAIEKINSEKITNDLNKYLDSYSQEISFLLDDDILVETRGIMISYREILLPQNSELKIKYLSLLLVEKYKFNDFPVLVKFQR
ncbi:DEAD/DEAH box helicase [Sulfolobus sp. E5-1-F]|uniref:DEAD/DEAH box helicase n=1 Tax=Saccharolobus sp. E5-1-F TaxID=2663019 RepID=UPI001297FE94|nr:DEAD/DEAH box helicase [Sulfolobus sp. E5-1-F]QGA53925.1 DEAD/DEAH box helicase [Sulfolobus sp. E5-1-F]